MKAKTRIFLFALPLLVCFVYSVSQKNGPSYQQLLSTYNKGQQYYDRATALAEAADYDEKKEKALNEQALAIFKNLLNEIPDEAGFDSLKFVTAFKTGELEHYMENFRAATAGYLKAIEVVQRGHLADSLLFKPYLYCGILYYHANNYDSAAYYFHQADRIQAKYGYRLEESERLYNTMGVLHYEKGDYRHAKNYFLKAIEILKPDHPYYEHLSANYQINLAQIYFKLEDYDQANTIYQHLIERQRIARDEIFHNTGLINLYLGAPQKAIGYFKKVNYTGSKIIWLYNNMGEAFLNMQQTDSARSYFQKALAAGDAFGANTDPLAIGSTQKNLGDLQLQLGRPLEALRYYQLAVQRFYPAYRDSSFQSNPQKFSGAFSYVNLFHTLVAKAAAFHELYRSTRQLSWALLELNTYQSAFDLTSYVQRTYQTDEARLFLEKIKYIVHGKPIDIAYELYLRTKVKKFLEDLYVFDQQNKASVLAIRQQQVIHREGKDSTLLEKERALRWEISRFSLRLSRATDSMQLTDLNNRIRDLEIELGRIQSRLIDSAGFVSNQIPTLGELQENFLDDKTAILSFHLSDSSITKLLISKKGYHCTQQKLFPDFHETILDYISKLKTPGSETAGPSKQLGVFLFDGLELEHLKRLIIIPDDELNYLAFESLQDIEGQYLVQKISLQYQYTTALLKKEKTGLAGQPTLAFAPFAKSGYKDSALNLEELPFSGQEIRDVQGAGFIDTAATRQNFLEHLPRYPVVHLATHARVDPEEADLSFIAFAPDGKKTTADFLLYAEEIYNLPLHQTKLVILSACETGSGNLVKGEGVMSLSRAFTYAGCNNIITSLWSANDFSTAYLTGRVHDYLNKDFTIDRALQQARLDYLADKTINPRLKHPYYWSHLVFIGNYHPDEKRSYWWWLAGAALLAVLVVLIKNKPFVKRAG